MCSAPGIAYSLQPNTHAVHNTDNIGVCLLNGCLLYEMKDKVMKNRDFCAISMVY